VGRCISFFIAMSWLIMLSPEGRQLGLVIWDVLICAVLRVSSWAGYRRDALFFQSWGSVAWLVPIGCFNLCSPEGEQLGWVREGCFNFFSPQGRQLGWVWDVLICSVLGVSTWVGYGMFNFVQSWGSAAGLGKGCFNLFSREGQQLGWVWDV
jgi:hypothetical protein